MREQETGAKLIVTTSRNDRFRSQRDHLQVSNVTNKATRTRRGPR